MATCWFDRNLFIKKINYEVNSTASLNIIFYTVNAGNKQVTFQVGDNSGTISINSPIIRITGIGVRCEGYLEFVI